MKQLKSLNVRFTSCHMSSLTPPVASDDDREEDGEEEEAEGEPLGHVDVVAGDSCPPPGSSGGGGCGGGCDDKKQQVHDEWNFFFFYYLGRKVGRGRRERKKKRGLGGQRGLPVSLPGKEKPDEAIQHHSCRSKSMLYLYTTY